jgi:hypothetical protein
VPTDDVLLILIRSSLIALNQANVTGNYSVLRDIGAPDFKQANGADRLAQIFAPSWVGVTVATAPQVKFRRSERGGMSPAPKPASKWKRLPKLLDFLDLAL